MPRSLLENIQKAMEDTIENEEGYDFPHFVFQLRENLGRSLNTVSKEIGISYNQLYRLENGYFLACKLRRLEKVAEYYGVDVDLLEDKCRAFLACRKKGKPL